MEQQRHRRFVEAGIEARRQVQEQHRRRVLAALAQVAHGTTAPTATVRAATCRRGQALSIATVRRHLVALELAGRVSSVGGVGKRGKRWGVVS